MSWQMGHLVLGPNFPGQQVPAAQPSLEQCFLQVQALLQLARSSPLGRYFVGVSQSRRLGLGLLQAATHAGHKDSFFTVLPRQSEASRESGCLAPLGPLQNLTGDS